MNQTQEDYVLDAVFVVNLLFFRSFIPSSPISVLVLYALAFCTRSNKSSIGCKVINVKELLN